MDASLTRPNEWKKQNWRPADIQKYATVLGKILHEKYKRLVKITSFNYVVAERHGQVSNAPASYTGDSGFKSRP